MISIITPTYNRAALVPDTIRSIQDQTCTDWELLLVDDGSTDDTGGAVEPFLQDRRIKYFRKENTGQADSLNYGARFAKGDYITFLDSDDTAFPGWLETAASHMQADTGIVCVGAIRRFPDGKLVKEGMERYRFFGRDMMLKFTSGSLFIRSDLFRAIQGYDANLRSNIQTDLGYRLLTLLEMIGLKAVPVEQYLLQINVHEGERIRTNWKKRREGGIQFIQKHLKFIRLHDPAEAGNVYASIAYSCYKLNRRLESLHYLMLAIRYHPRRLINYFRVLKYTLL
ncbi:glycosyltransferase family 2 protein [Pseudoflavitalea rhizosphaerae]|uniref:glycosyltransferase family 2 protein n=1 Tax=Pseudoflavitalea rhizosphaerae TaxID=1884793 RepID=UPI000F8E5A83|nr:glycosyltransferase family A protein [Pseudoflavitalea rhizosphaerae]